MSLDCHGLARSYNGKPAVTGLGFAMREGEALALIGPNGAGKTTALGILTTAIRPDAGSATVLGYDIRKEPARIRASLGVLFQDPTLDDCMTPRATLRFHAALHGLSREETRNRVGEALHWAALEEVADAPVGAFSGGMKRRLELVRAMMHRPQLLVLDEPTLGLDPQGRLDLWQRIHALRKTGMAVLMTTHVLTEVEGFDRVAIMDSGRLIALDTPEALKTIHGGSKEASLEDVFLHLTGRALRDTEINHKPTLIRRRA